MRVLCEFLRPAQQEWCACAPACGAVARRCLQVKAAATKAAKREGGGGEQEEGGASPEKKGKKKRARDGEEGEQNGASASKQASKGDKKGKKEAASDSGSGSDSDSEDEAADKKQARRQRKLDKKKAAQELPGERWRWCAGAGGGRPKRGWCSTRPGRLCGGATPGGGAARLWRRW